MTATARRSAWSPGTAAEPPPGANPLLRDTFTADPAPLVVGDTVYLYVGHDEARGVHEREAAARALRVEQEAHARHAVQGVERRQVGVGAAGIVGIGYLTPPRPPLVEKRPIANIGDIVVAVVDNDYTLKTLDKEDGEFVLRPANPDFPVIRPHGSLEIFGVLTGLVRKYRR